MSKITNDGLTRSGSTVCFLYTVQGRQRVNNGKGRLSDERGRPGVEMTLLYDDKRRRLTSETYERSGEGERKLRDMTYISVVAQ